MANPIAATVLQQANAKLMAESQKDLRPSANGALQAAFDNENIVKNLAQIKESELQPTAVYAALKSGGSAGAAESCTPTATNINSVSVPVTFVYKDYTFSIPRAVIENNMMRDTYVADSLTNAKNILYAAKNAEVIAFLEANRATAEGARTGNATWSGTPDFISLIANADKDYLPALIKTDLQAEDYQGNISLVGSNNLSMLMLKMGMNGVQNAENQALQLSLGFKPYIANITPSTGNYCDVYAFENGSFGATSWLPSKFKSGIYEHANRKYYSMPDPIFGMIGVTEYETCADTSQSSGGGVTADPVTFFTISIWTGLVKSPLTSGSPIYKYGLLNK